MPAASIVRRSRRLVPAEQGGTTRGKKINGIKRHLLVDTIGLIWAVVVHPANIQDRDGAKLVFTRAKINADWTRMQRVWAEAAMRGN